MSMNERVFAYCERGLDPGLFAEPLNAVTNAAFVAAGVAAWVQARRHAQPTGAMTTVFAAMLVAIGIGSLLFHTLATRWAGLADVIPIGIFMLSYWAYAVRSYLRASRALTALATIGFAIALWAAGELRCPAAGGLAWRVGESCLNGSLGYVPALLAMPTIGILAVRAGHPAAPRLFAAGAVFVVSLSLRSLDWRLCDVIAVGNYRIGSHFLWHLLNATTLYLLTRSAALHGRAPWRAP